MELRSGGLTDNVTDLTALLLCTLMELRSGGLTDNFTDLTALLL